MNNTVGESGPSSAGDGNPSAISTWLTPTTIAYALLLIANLVLVSPLLIPNFGDINAYDEAKYLDSGRRLVLGSLRGLEWSPLSSFLYAPLYLIVQHSPDWFLELASLGRFSLFVLLWISMMTLAQSLRRWFAPVIVAGLVLVETTFTTIVSNSSDALFASMSTLALAMLFAFYNSGRPSRLGLASVFMGLAILSRNDGFFLLPVFWMAVAYLIRRNRLPTGRALATVLLPGILIVGTYVGLSAIRSGQVTLGTTQRGYSAYQWSLGNNLGLNTTQIEAEIGTPDDNEQSVVKAIVRAPGLFSRQLLFNLARVPAGLLAAYDKRVGPAVFVLGLAGLWALAVRRAIFPLVLLLTWPLHSILYIAFYLRPGFFLLDEAVVFAFAAAGVQFLSRPSDRWISLVGRSAPFAALAAIGLASDKLALVPAGAIPLASLWIAWLLGPRTWPQPRLATHVLLALLAAGLVLHRDYPFPNYSKVTDTPRARAVRYLEQNLEPGTRVIVTVPMPAVASRMEPILWSEVDRTVDSQDDFLSYLKDNEVATLYVSPDFIRSFPSLWTLVQATVSRQGERVFVGDPGSIQIFTVSLSDSFP